ncbi:neutral zinc metallopeptidase, partial [Enterobacter hormaechei]
NKLGAGGDFAQGYVIAHEVGHHVQKLLGIESKVRQLQQNASQAEANRLSVKMELQADCFAGVWGYNMQKQDYMETGDLQ